LQPVEAGEGQQFAGVSPMFEVEPVCNIPHQQRAEGVHLGKREHMLSPFVTCTLKFGAIARARHN
jgi:hypothetical protein